LGRSFCVFQHLAVEYSIEPSTILSVASGNNLFQKPKTEYSPCRPSLSPVNAFFWYCTG